MMKSAKNYLVPFFLFIVLSLVFFYALVSSFNFHPDFARDAYDMLMIIQGKPTLIGPKLSFGGFYSGPYYYYLFVPTLAPTKLNLSALLYFNAAFFLFALGFFYIQVSKRYGVFGAAAATLIIAFFPVYLIFARSPWNGSTYLPFLLVFLTLLYFSDFKKRRRIRLLFLGLLGGVIATMHFAAIPIIAVSVVYLLYFMRKRADIIYFLIGLALAVSPLVLFEIKHNFVMLKNTFFAKSYTSFIENKNIPYAVSGKKNFFENMIFISQQLSSQLGASLVLYGLAAIAFFRKLRDRRDRFLVVCCFVLVFLFSLILRFQFGQHYLFALSLFIVFTVAVALLHTKHQWLLLFILILEISSFPKGIYQYQARKPERYEKAVQYVIDHSLVKKGDSFNLIQYSKDYTIYVPVGHEYRFFFRKNHILPKSEFEYRTSATLLIFSEIDNLDIEKLDSWEINQFGRQYLQNSQRYQIGDISLFIVKKT